MYHMPIERHEIEGQSAVRGIIGLICVSMSI